MADPAGTLKAIRKGLDLSQVEMAERLKAAGLKVSPRTYQRWESGETRVTAEALLTAQSIAKRRRRS